jgi:hypothetical protein
MSVDSYQSGAAVRGGWPVGTQVAFDPLAPLNRSLVEVRVPRDLWAAAAAFDSPRFVGWDAEPAGKVSLDWGTAWARGTSTLLALVLFFIVVEESNVLLNPAHPDARRVRAAKVRRWLYDGRLVT